jgi:hypothetical protein
VKEIGRTFSSIIPASEEANFRDDDERANKERFFHAAAGGKEVEAELEAQTDAVEFGLCPPRNSLSDVEKLRLVCSEKSPGTKTRSTTIERSERSSVLAVVGKR